MSGLVPAATISSLRPFEPSVAPTYLGAPGAVGVDDSAAPYSASMYGEARLNFVTVEMSHFLMPCEARVGNSLPRLGFSSVPWSILMSTVSVSAMSAYAEPVQAYHLAWPNMNGSMVSTPPSVQALSNAAGTALERFSLAKAMSSDSRMGSLLLASILIEPLLATQPSSWRNSTPSSSVSASCTSADGSESVSENV